MKEKILITAALPYANGAMHFGHLAGCYLPADVYARFHRLIGDDVLFISGSDEYGVAIQLSAEMAKRTPEAHVEIFHAVNKKLFQEMNIQFDHFSRTSWKGHVEAVYQYFNDLLKNGLIEERESEQLYSEQDKKFLADRYVVGTCPKCGYEQARGDECTKCGSSFDATDLKNPRSKLTGNPLVLKKTTHWYIRLDLMKEKLLKWIEKKNWKPNVMNFAKGYIEELRPRAITRDMNWGIPVPLEKAKGKVLYVWFDAPIGYISATKEWANGSEKWKEYWQDPKTKLVQFLGKDNIPFHAAIFPAMTMGQNEPYKLVDELFANEFYNYEGRQFSKSDNWTIDVEEFLKRYDVDMIRYAIASNGPETQDSEFSWRDFQLRVNSDLVGKFGNFVNRTLVFLQNVNGGKLPLKGDLKEIDQKFLSDIRVLTNEIRAAFDGAKLRRACQLIMEMAQTGNIYFDLKKPWADAKQEETRATMQTTLYCCLECVKLLALVAFSVIPKSAEKIWSMIASKPLHDMKWDEILEYPQSEMKLSAPQILFRKIEDAEIEKELVVLKTPVKEASTLVTIDDVRKLDLRIGKILHAEKVEKSQKLLRLEVDIGDGEKRQIMAGVQAYFQPETLIGKQVVVVANLKPAKLMGLESQGMLLAAEAGGVMHLLEVPHPPGTKVS